MNTNPDRAHAVQKPADFFHAINNPPSLADAFAALGLQEHFEAGFRASHAGAVALRASGIGFSLFPAFEKTKTPCVKGFQFLKPFNANQMARWLKRYPDCNWLFQTGRSGGVWIVDVDGPQGRDDLAKLESELGQLPQTWTVESGRIGGGEHRWFLPTPDSQVELKNQQHLNGLSIDVRAWHGYVVGPGSIHEKTGVRYRWRDGCAPEECALAELPPAWLDYLPKKEFGEKQSSPARRRSGGPSVRVPHDPRSYKFGDDPDCGGFQNPAFKNAIRYFQLAGIDAPIEQIIAALWRMIQAAPKSEGRDVSRYEPGGGDLERLVKRAREFVKALKS